MYFRPSAAPHLRTSASKAQDVGARAPWSGDLASETWKNTNPDQQDGRPQNPAHYSTTSFVELKLSQVMRDVLVAPETKSVLDLLRDFQRRRRHLAIVVRRVRFHGWPGYRRGRHRAAYRRVGRRVRQPRPPRPHHGQRSPSHGWRRQSSRPRNPNAVEPAPRWRLSRPWPASSSLRLGHIPKGGESVTYESAASPS